MLFEIINRLLKKKSVIALERTHPCGLSARREKMVLIEFREMKRFLRRSSSDVARRDVCAPSKIVFSDKEIVKTLLSVHFQKVYSKKYIYTNLDILSAKY